MVEGLVYAFQAMQIGEQIKRSVNKRPWGVVTEAVARYKRLEIEIDGVFVASSAKFLFTYLFLFLLLLCLSSRKGDFEVRLMLLKKKKYAAKKVVDWEKQIFETEFKGCCRSCSYVFDVSLTCHRQALTLSDEIGASLPKRWARPS